MKKVEGEDEWTLLGTITGAIKTAIKWIGSLFCFDGTLAGAAASIINIALFLPNMVAKGILAAGKWLLKLFGFDEAAEKVANPDKFSNHFPAARIPFATMLGRKSAILIMLAAAPARVPSKQKRLPIHFIAVLIAPVIVPNNVHSSSPSTFFIRSCPCK
jgi:hypothetical protein